MPATVPRHIDCENDVEDAHGYQHVAGHVEKHERIAKLDGEQVVNGLPTLSRTFASEASESCEHRVGDSPGLPKPPPDLPGGSWALISRVRSIVTIVTTLLRVLLTLLRSTHE